MTLSGTAGDVASDLILGTEPVADLCKSSGSSSRAQSADDMISITSSGSTSLTSESSAKILRAIYHWDHHRSVNTV